MSTMSKRIWTWCFLLAAGCGSPTPAPDESAVSSVVVTHKKRPPLDPNHAKMVARMEAPYHPQLALPDMRLPEKQAPKLKGVPTPGPSGGFPSQGGNANKFLMTNGTSAAWTNISLQRAYNGGAVIDESGPGEGAGPVTIQAHSTTDSTELLQVLDHSGNVLFNIFDSTLSTNGTTFIKRLFLFGGDEIVSSGGLAPNDGDVMAYDAGVSKWYGHTLIPSQGGNSGKVLGTNGSTTSWVGVGVPANTLWFDYTKYALHDDSNCVGGYTQAFSAHATGTNQATSLFVTPIVNSTATGLHFYTSFATPVTATCTLYVNAATPTSLASGTVATSGRGLYQCVFSSGSGAMTAGTPYYFAIYTPGNSTSLITCNSGGNPFDYEGQMMGPSMIFLTAGFCTGAAGADNPPNSCGSTKYPIAPEFTVP